MARANAVMIYEGAPIGLAIDRDQLLVAAPGRPLAIPTERRLWSTRMQPRAVGRR